MNLVVCDTGPINYLIQIEAIEVLPRLFDRILIPPSVHLELTSAAAPKIVQTWTRQLPSWGSVRNVDCILQETFPGLSPADVEVLSLAKEAGAAVVIDDLAARRAARVLMIPLVGTLGILELAAMKGLISLPDALARLRSTNIHLAQHLYDEILRRNGLK